MSILSDSRFLKSSTVMPIWAGGSGSGAGILAHHPAQLPLEKLAHPANPFKPAFERGAVVSPVSMHLVAP